jgi:hypothetical protein
MASEWPRTTPDWYRLFAEHELRGYSPTYERLSLGVADDPDLLARLDQLPEPKRQPNLLFAATRYLDGPVDDWTTFREWVLEHWDEMTAVILRRRTQTNEAGRCAALLPVLAQLPQPLALLEVGASAGLCLYPDRYRYRYGSDVLGAGDGPILECAIRGPVPVPTELPTVAWRAGLDLNPLDVSDVDDVRWLEALIWPEHQHRRDRLRAAVAIARADPPRLVRGDLLDDLPALAEKAPAGATLVVFHSSVVTYVPDGVRRAFVEQVTVLSGHWVSNEGPQVIPGIPRPSVEQPSGMPGLLSLDGRALAYTGAHGQSLLWFEP